MRIKLDMTFQISEQPSHISELCSNTVCSKIKLSLIKLVWHFEVPSSCNTVFPGNEIMFPGALFQDMFQKSR